MEPVPATRADSPDPQPLPLPNKDGRKPKGKGKGKGKASKATSKTDLPSVNSDDDTGTQKKRKTEPKLKLSSEQEDRALEFIRDHEDFWRRGAQNYKCRNQILGVLATELEVDVDALLVWWKSLRDWNRRVHKQKSGDRLKLRTDRENWLVQKLSFLKVEEVNMDLSYVIWLAKNN